MKLHGGSLGCTGLTKIRQEVVVPWEPEDSTSDNILFDNVSHAESWPHISTGVYVSHTPVYSITVSVNIHVSIYIYIYIYIYTHPYVLFIHLCYR